MKVCFNLDNLTFRGTTTAILDYAHYNREILNNESIISFPKQILNDNFDVNFSKRFEIANKLMNSYDVIQYNTMDDLKCEMNSRDCDVVYFLKGGTKDSYYVPGKKNLIHCVFNYYQPHGEKYAYISEWLSNEASGGTCPVVPHIVSLPEKPNSDLRTKLNIPKDKIVVGRYGGYDQFDIPFVGDLVHFIVNNDPDVVFVFVNTRKFIDHSNVIFLDPIIEPIEKTNYISACDFMIHARSDGESFGLSVCEFLFHNKPVLTFGGGRDKNNVELLKQSNLVYYNQYDFISKFALLKNKMYNYNYKMIVEQFSPENVMKKFDEVFLK